MTASTTSWKEIDDTMEKLDDADDTDGIMKAQHELPTTTPSKGKNSFSTVKALASASRARKQKLAIGFTLGILVLSFVFIAMEADNQTRQHAHISAHAAGEVPPVIKHAHRNGTVNVSNDASYRSSSTGKSRSHEQASDDDGDDDEESSEDPDMYTIGEYISGMGVKDFDPDAPAVIVTKIHGRETILGLEQSICLMTKAYNDRVKYDVIVFVSVPLAEEDMLRVRSAAAPASLKFVVDNPGLKEMVDALEPAKQEFLLKRCNATNSSTLTWFHRCYEEASDNWSNERIAYNWQAEFRAKHLWHHPSLLNYKYMLWMDSDAFCTKVWKQDPIATMIRHDLVILFDHFPQGLARGTEWPALTMDAFGKAVCDVYMRNGSLFFEEGGCLGEEVYIAQVHGFFHVTNLEFYRSAPVTNWFNIMIGNTTFSRFYDDQIGVTIPAAVMAGNRSWDMYYHGLKLDVAHNFIADGRPWQRVGGFKMYWHGKNGSKTFPEADGVCRVTQAG